jgi:uncharacterized protein YggU (UPF0235/DUF167 family)
MACIVAIKVIPGSSRNRCMLDKNGMLKWYVCAVAEKGKANDELITSLAKRLRCPVSVITILGGATSRYKKVLIKSVQSPKELLEILGLSDTLHQQHVPTTAV